MDDLGRLGRLRQTDGPLVMLEAALTQSGAVVALCVHVYDGTRAQVLRAPLFEDPDGLTITQLEDAADFWLCLLDGNSRECQRG